MASRAHKSERPGEGQAAPTGSLTFVTKKASTLLAASAAVVALGAVGGLPAADGAVKKSATVRVSDFQYSPASVSIRRGGTVTWRFVGGSHNVVGKRWGSRKLRTGGKWKHQFRRKGNFSYLCTVHPWMKGSVKVR